MSGLDVVRYSLISWDMVPAGTAAIVAANGQGVATADGSTFKSLDSKVGGFLPSIPMTTSSGMWSNLGTKVCDKFQFLNGVSAGTIVDCFCGSGWNQIPPYASGTGCSAVSLALGYGNSTMFPDALTFPLPRSGGDGILDSFNTSNCATLLDMTNYNDPSPLVVQNATDTSCVRFRFLFTATIPFAFILTADVLAYGGFNLIQAVAVYPLGSVPPSAYGPLTTGIALSSAALKIKGSAGTSVPAPVVSMQPVGAVEIAVTWSSDSDKIATVDPKSGLITAVATGSANISATATSAAGIKFTASAAVAVTIPILATGLIITPATLQNVNLTGPAPVLTAQIQPSNTDVKTLTWLSSDTSVATVDSTGKVILAGPGTTTITASTTDGSKQSANITITVVSQVTDITFTSGSVSLNTLNQPYTPKFTVAPSNASNTTLSWSSDTKAVASVDAAGTVTPLSNGTAVITATATDGGTASARFKVTVAATAPSVRISSISFNGVSNVPLNTLNQPYTPTFTIMPSNASNPALTWSSDTQAVASVNAATGTVTPLSYGKAVITATANDGSNVSATLTVVVKDSGTLKPKTKGHHSAVPMTLILIIAGVVVFLGVALAVFFVHRKKKSVQA